MSQIDWVKKLYRHLLSREASQQEAEQWAMHHNRIAVATAILYSREAREDFVKGLYRQFLGRTADQAELNAHASALLAGDQIETVLARILSSDEYFNRIQS